MDAALGPRSTRSRRARRQRRLIGVMACALAGGLAVSIGTGLHPAATPTRADRAAQALLAPGAADAGAVSRINTLTEASLAHRPLDAAALLRLAYVASASEGGLDDRANDWVLRSYSVEPLGSEISFWRLGFIFDHWSTASPDVRRAALGEFRSIYPRRSWDLDALARTAADPQGRMTAMITARRLRRASLGPARPV